MSFWVCVVLNIDARNRAMSAGMEIGTANCRAASVLKENGPPQVLLETHGLNQGESLIHFSQEEKRFGLVGITASLYRPFEESAIHVRRSLFKPASPRVDERGYAPTKYRQEGGIALKQQRWENERPACDGDNTRRRREGRRNLEVSKRVVLAPLQIRDLLARRNIFSFSERKQDGILASVFKTPASSMRRGSIKGMEKDDRKRRVWKKHALGKTNKRAASLRRP